MQSPRRKFKNPGSGLDQAVLQGVTAIGRHLTAYDNNSEYYKTMDPVYTLVLIAFICFCIWAIYKCIKMDKGNDGSDGGGDYWIFAGSFGGDGDGDGDGGGD